MKIALFLLVVLGIVAAGAATLFVQSTSLLQPKEPPTFEVLVAAADLPARTTLTEAQVEVRKMPRTGLPADFLSNFSQAAGKILKVALVQGQPLAGSQFIPKNSIDDLLRPGMLAFSAPISTRQTAVDLLYPGCIVDVFATFPLRERTEGDAVVTPLLQNIQVLAIADDTVIPVPQTRKGVGTALEEAAPKKRTSTSGSVTVTLEVTARQAAALQLALEKGTLGLAMRNPTDKGWNPMEPMVIKEGRLTASSEALDPQTLAWVTDIQRLLNPERAPAEPTGPRPAAAARAADPNAPAAVPPPPLPPPVFPGMTAQPKKTAWPMEIIRGPKVEKTELDLAPEGKEEKKE